MENKLKFSVIDSWRNRFVIGLDMEVKKIVYISDGISREEKIIDLAQLESVSIHFTEHIVGTGKNTEKVIDLLELHLYFHEIESGPAPLLFFDGNIFSDIHNEFPLIQKWHKLLLPLVSERVETMEQKKLMHE